MYEDEAVGMGDTELRLGLIRISGPVDTADGRERHFLRIEERRVGSDEVWTFEVTGEQPTAVHMLPGYTHNIINLSDTDDLVTLMWANERFDPDRPDTFFLEV